ncbi:MAG: GtrA family protein [Gemmatimonadales bacterium]
MNLLTSRKEQKRFAKFAIVGGIGMSVDFLVFNFFFALIRLAPIVSSVLSFVAAVTSNFILNRNWTFRDARGKRMRVQLAQYILVNVIGLLIRTPIFAGLALVFHGALDARVLPFGVNASWLTHNLALAGAIGVVLLWNYFVNRKWTFGDVA